MATADGGPKNARSRDGRIGCFDALRLLFALSVVLMHSVRLIDGDNHREFLQKLFGIRALMGYGSGDLAVDGFFALSGYFATGAVVRSCGLGGYLLNRARRIYPGYIASSILSQSLFVFLAVGSLDAWIHEVSLPRRLFELALLQFPAAHFPFHVGRWYAEDLPPVNAPLWMIAHQARCYLLAGAIGFLARRLGWRWWARGWWIVLAAVLAVIASGWEIPRFPAHHFLVDNQTFFLRFTACFAAGCLFRHHEEAIPRKWWIPPVVAACFACCLAHEPSLPLAIPVLFAPLVLLVGRSERLARVLPRVRIDLSFGIFLYAWPLQIVLLHRDPGIGLAALFGASSLGAALLAWASLAWVERPCLRGAPVAQGVLKALRTLPK